MSEVTASVESENDQQDLQNCMNKAAFNNCNAEDYINIKNNVPTEPDTMDIDALVVNFKESLKGEEEVEKKEFLIVAQRQRIIRVDLEDPKLEILPISQNLQNVIAIEFDMRNNCVYWADIVNDTISRQCLSDGSQGAEIIVKTNLDSIEGMAFDWVSNTLYFVDGMRTKIEVVRTDIHYEGRMRRTILDSRNLKKPRGIAVHPMEGFIFWTDWAPGDPSLSRANLDGSDVKRLFVKPRVEWPNGITIDHIAERIYWVDAKLDYIASAALDGSKFKEIIANDLANSLVVLSPTAEDGEIEVRISVG
uniref:Uncharacterized protein n=1 Tax=Timema genevievae TaxID=629358 RepID=A0A7R9K159_TIMGE|nr:unnamed protein product [Timema genevievae]